MTANVITSPPQTTDGFSPDELDHWDRHGFVISRGLGDPDLMQQMSHQVLLGLEQLIEPIEFEADVHYPGAPVSRESEGGKTVRRLKQAHSRGFAFTEWLQYPKIVRRLRQLLGPTIACPLAHHNCIMTKSPRYSSRTAWHQDIRYWSFAERELVSVWLALGNETSENGCLQLIPGTHKVTFSPDRLDSELFLREDLPENAELISTAIDAPLEPGDVLFFHCRTFHAAGANSTSETKHSVVFTYRGGDNAPLPGSRSASLPEMLITPDIESS